MLLAGLLLLTGGEQQDGLPYPDNATATLTIGSSELHRVDDCFVGATIDWWRHNDPIYGKKFGFAGALTIDLEAPGLIAVAKALSPGLLRVGGSNSPQPQTHAR